MQGILKKKEILRFLIIGILLSVLLFSLCEKNVYAANTADTVGSQEVFQIEAELLPSKDIYISRINITNHGKDWEGTVRVLAWENYYKSAAYDMELILPQGTTKQFEIKIPKTCFTESTGHMSILLMDGKKIIREEKFHSFFRDELDVLKMGILSDKYSLLTFMDAGGQGVHIGNFYFPVKLEEMNNDNIQDSLETLHILVIDTYNTDILSEDTKNEINKWVANGGILIVGTGEYAEDTLVGLDSFFYDVNSPQIYAPGEMADNVGSRYCDLQMLHMVEFTSVGGNYVRDVYTTSFIKNEGDGAVCLVPFALSELSGMDSSFFMAASRDELVRLLLEDILSYSSLSWQKTSYYDSIPFYQTGYLRALTQMNDSANFWILGIMAVVYVIFVGPVLYLLLRKYKKAEWYWYAVPVTMLVGVFVLYLAGKGFEIKDIRAVSVTLCDTGRQEEITYYQCYAAKNKEWKLKLSKDYEYAAPFADEQYGGDDEKEYFHHIKKETDALRIGINPSFSFENAYFQAGKRGSDIPDRGRIDVQGVEITQNRIRGKVVNNTNHDFAYMAVIQNDILYVYDKISAGEVCNLGIMIPTFSCTKSGYGNAVFDDFRYDFFEDYYDESKNNDLAKERGCLTGAMGIAIYEIGSEMNPNQTVVIGVTDQWETTLEGNCSEQSYGVLFVVD